MQCYLLWDKNGLYNSNIFKLEVISTLFKYVYVIFIQLKYAKIFYYLTKCLVPTDGHQGEKSGKVADQAQSYAVTRTPQRRIDPQLVHKLGR